MSALKQIKFVYLFIVYQAFYGCESTSHKNPIEKITIPAESIIATQDQQTRRTQSEAYCKAHNLPIYTNPKALFVDPEIKVILRTKDEVVDRALALCYIGLKSEGLDQKALNKMEKDYHIGHAFTLKEKAYANTNSPTEQQKIDANWKYECLHVMLWAMGYIDSMNYPDKLCDVGGDVKIIHDLTEVQFRQKAKLRSKKEILDQADLILRIHWACVNSRIDNKPMPGHLESEVVSERHYALNWLIKYMNQDWDDITIDT